MWELVFMLCKEEDLDEYKSSVPLYVLPIIICHVLILLSLQNVDAHFGKEVQ